MDDLGQALRERRKLLGLSQLEVAKRNNISLAFVKS
jgi:transcriptional regulator with XRE-family HTH domain